MANTQDQGGSNKGFGSMDEDKRRDAASKGGKAAHESDNASQGGSSHASPGNQESRGGSHEQHVKAGEQSHKNK